MGWALNILYVSADAGGCRHYRCLLPGAELARAGHNVHVDGGFVLKASGEIGARIGNFDVYGFELVVLQRWMSHRAPDIIRRARSTGQVVVNDVDDWWFGIPTANRAFIASHPTANPDHNADHYRSVLAASDAITTSTGYLADRLRVLGRPVHVLENMIDLDRWVPRPVLDTTDPALGWVGAVDYRSPGDLAQLAGVVGPFLSRHPGSRFVHVGDAGTGQALATRTGVAWSRIHATPRTTLEELPQAMSLFDVALAPLEDTPFNRAKSWIKALEAGAAGIPIITADMPEYRTLSIGIQARKPRDWTRALERLSDPCERRTLAEQGRERAAMFDIASTWTRWRDVYAGLPSLTEEAAR